MTLHSEKLRHGKEQTTEMRTWALDAHGDAVHTLCRIKHLPRFACIIKAVIKAMRHSKPPP